MFVITGGGSGIGRALASELTRQGKQVLIVGRRKEALLETAKVSSLISVFAADIANTHDRQKLVEHLHSAKLEGLVHNAGVVDPIMPMASIEEGDWENFISTNLNAPLFLSQSLLPQLTGGRVLHIGSGAAHFPVVGWAGYCVTKAALSMLTRCWQLENKNPAFANVKPGIIDTDMQTLIRHSHSMDPEKIDFFKQLKQENRLLSPATVALFLTWLLLTVKASDFVSEEWDIYDTKHHQFWLTNPHTVPHWE